MFETIGERITYCRNLLGYTRNKFVSSFQEISLPTICRWELNYVSIPDNKLDKLVNFFTENGLNVNKNWLKNGDGIPPINCNLNDVKKKSFDEVAYLSLLSMKQQIKNFDFKQIQSNFFYPIISYGDYVGGVINKNYHELDKKLCFLISENQVDVGFFNYKKQSIHNMSNQIIIYKDISSILIGELMCLIKRP